MIYFNYDRQHKRRRRRPKSSFQMIDFKCFISETPNSFLNKQIFSRPELHYLFKTDFSLITFLHRWPANVSGWKIAYSFTFWLRRSKHKHSMTYARVIEIIFRLNCCSEDISEGFCGFRRLTADTRNYNRQSLVDLKTRFYCWIEISFSTSSLYDSLS